MTEAQKPASADKPKKPPRPPRINGPAVFVFGLMGVILGLSIDALGSFIWAGALIMLVGAYGIWALKRYEKAQGIEEELPGRGRYDSDGKVMEKDKG